MSKQDEHWYEAYAHLATNVHSIRFSVHLSVHINRLFQLSLHLSWHSSSSILTTINRSTTNKQNIYTWQFHQTSLLPLSLSLCISCITLLATTLKSHTAYCVKRIISAIKVHIVVEYHSSEEFEWNMPSMQSLSGDEPHLNTEHQHNQMDGWCYCQSCLCMHAPLINIK